MSNAQTAVRLIDSGLKMEWVDVFQKNFSSLTLQQGRAAWKTTKSSYIPESNCLAFRIRHILSISNSPKIIAAPNRKFSIVKIWLIHWSTIKYFGKSVIPQNCISRFTRHSGIKWKIRRKEALFPPIIEIWFCHPCTKSCFYYTWWPKPY